MSYFYDYSWNNNTRYFQKKHNNGNKNNKKQNYYDNSKETLMKTEKNNNNYSIKKISERQNHYENEVHNQKEKNRNEEQETISKAIEETSITNFQHELLGAVKEEENSMKEINENLKLILTRLDEIDLEKRNNKITAQINENCSQIKQEVKNAMFQIKSDLEGKLERCNENNSKKLKEIKLFLSLHYENDLRKQLIALKGEPFSKSVVITSVIDFEKFYESILSVDLREKFVYDKPFSEIIHSIYIAYKGKEDISTEEKFWFLINNFRGDNKKKRKIKFNLSGSIYRIIKHIRNMPDEIIIEFGDIIPMIENPNQLVKAKKKISVVINLIYEILSRQVQMSGMSNKTYGFGHIYYGCKTKSIEMIERFENEIYFDYVQLK